MLHLSASGLFGMVFEHLQVYFHLEWVPLVISILFSYHTSSHSTLNYTCPWNNPPLSHDQAFKWNLSHCSVRNVVLTHKPHFMPSIL